MKRFDTTTSFINNAVKSGGYTANEVIETLGYSTAGSVGGARWKSTGNIIAASQDPITLNDIKLSDASGNEFELVLEEAGIIDLNVLGGTSAGFIVIANAAGLTYSQGLTSDVSDDVKKFDTLDDAVIGVASLSIDNVIYCAGRSSVGTGAAHWVCVDATSVTENEFDIVTGDATISFQINTDNAPPTMGQLGVGANATTNSTIMQYSADTYGAIALDTDFTFDQTLVLRTVGTRIYSIGANKDLTWSGLDAEWAIEAETDSGSYDNDFRNFKLIASAVTKQLFNAMWVRFSFFENFICTKGAVGMLHNACWNNLFIECHFINTFNTAGSIGVDFRHDAGETFNVSNDCKFVRCLFNTNEIGIRLEAGGDALNFDTCGIETNTWGVDITGIGNCHSVSFDYCYIEKNTSGNFRWNKTGSGNIFGLFIHKNYFGTESAARAGIIEFVGDNGATHNISIKDNSFRVFNGAPSTTFLLDVNGATMANIYIDWYNNNFADSGVVIFPFDKTDVDWRYMSTDVGCQLDLQAPGVRTWTTDETLIVMVEAGTATLTGVFDSIDNVQTAAINVTDAMPIFLRPAQFTQQLCTSITDASTAATAVTCMINGGQLRTIGITDDTVRVHMTWRLSQNQRTTETDIS